MVLDPRLDPQSICLMETEGWEHIPIFDEMPQAVRERLRQSPYNLCAACVAIRAQDRMAERVDETGCEPERIDDDWLAAIEGMEALIEVMDDG